MLWFYFTFYKYRYHDRKYREHLVEFCIESNQTLVNKRFLTLKVFWVVGFICKLIYFEGLADISSRPVNQKENGRDSKYKSRAQGWLWFSFSSHTPMNGQRRLQNTSICTKNTREEFARVFFSSEHDFEIDSVHSSNRQSRSYSFL